ncbi:MAG TPA: GDSL-type esterase/lipase family protein [Thermoanaerobaculia bacterium]|nr:GDSL-type esterase/lipase family protein [Thermoanaerobaculia bacterium]
MSRRRSPALLAVLLALTALPAAGQTKYVAFGDSITEGTGFDDPSRQCPEECGYAPRLEALLDGAGMPSEVVNAGKGGERTPEGLTRLPDVLAEHGGDVLLLMEGSNDVSRSISPETTLFNLNEMARTARSHGLRPVHATLIPRIPSAQVDGENRINQRLNMSIRELAFDRGRDLVDPFEVFWSHPNTFAELYHPGPDVVGHPSSAGYDLLARVFFDVLRGVDSVPPVPGGLEPQDGARDVSPNAVVRLRLYDFGAGIDLGATDLLIDGEPVAASLEGDSRRLDLRYSPVTPFSGLVEVGYRTRDLAPAANRGETTLGSFLVQGAALLLGDVNSDGRVDGHDLVELAIRFGTVDGESRYARFVDLNRDGRIDGEDLAILASEFGRSAG